MYQKIIQNLLTIVNQLKYYHWQTDSYSKHKALGKAYDTLNGLVDDFVEILLGKYGKELSPISINIKTESELDYNSAIEEISNYLSYELSNILDEKDTDLLNIRDEMLAIVNKTKYLLTLN
jgi:DNA-binding ferritin-like protein